ncbi:heat shock factor-binding protein 1 [Urocitellus parryii]
MGGTTEQSGVECVSSMASSMGTRGQYLRDAGAQRWKELRIFISSPRKVSKQTRNDHVQSDIDLAAKLGTGETAETDPKTVQDLTSVVQTLLQQMQDKFQTMSDQIIGRIDDMSSRIDDLEKNIADLMTQAGVEELEGENKIPATQKS